MANYYPIMLDIRDRPALVIGGNQVAAEKAAALAASGARVTVQAAEFGAEVQALAHQGRVTLRPKAYVPGDLAGAFVVVAAVTYEPELVAAIWAEGQQRNQLVNIVDVPAKCAFIVPSILRRGQLTIAVSTEGSIPVWRNASATLRNAISARLRCFLAVGDDRTGTPARRECQL